MTAGAAEFPPPDGTAWPAAIAALAAGQDRTFGSLIDACVLDAQKLARRPYAEAWCGREILEHVALTNRFLLLLADKIADRCRRRLGRGLAWPTAPARFELLRPLTQREFAWAAPRHMIPTGTLSLRECAEQLASDHERCRALLAEFPGGEGTLHRIRMSVVEERLDLYQYIALLGLHAARHRAQLERTIEAG